MILLIESIGKIMNGAVAQLQGNLADSILILPEHLAAPFQLHIADVFLGGLVHRIFKEQLQ